MKKKSLKTRLKEQFRSPQPPPPINLKENLQLYFDKETRMLGSIVSCLASPTVGCRACREKMPVNYSLDGEKYFDQNQKSTQNAKVRTIFGENIKNVGAKQILKKKNFPQIKSCCTSCPEICSWRGGGSTGRETAHTTG